MASCGLARSATLARAMAKAAEKGGDDKIPSDDAQIPGYLLQLERYLTQCARDIDARPDAFLWNARRSIEAMARVILIRGAVPTSVDMTLDNLLEVLGKKHLPAGDRNAFRNVQNEGNFGVHVQRHDAPSYERSVERCRPSLQDAVTWFYTQPGMPPMPDQVKRALDVLARRAPSFLKVEQDAKADADSALEMELASAKRDLAAVRKESASLRRELEGKLEAARKENADLQRELDQARCSPAGLAVSTTNPAVLSSPWATKGRVRAVLGAVLLAGAAAAAGGYVLRRSSTTASNPPLPAPPPSVTIVDGTAVAPAVAAASAGVPEGEGALASARPAPVAAAPPVPSAEASAAPVGGCPDETIPVAGGDVEFGEPFPRSWLKAPKKSGLHATVAPFCLDQHAVRARDFEAGKRASERDRGFRSTCNAATDRSGSAVNCVTHTEAEAWCKDRGARLPSLAEWEFVASIDADRKLDLPGKTGEWIADPFPAPAWNRGPSQNCEGEPCFLARGDHVTSAPPGGARFSWTRYAASKWLGTITFRCARDRR